MIEDQFAWALLSVLFVALRLHAMAADRAPIPIAQPVRMGCRLRRFIAWEELAATIRAKFPHRAPPLHLRTGLRYQGDYLVSNATPYAGAVPMPERPDSRLC